MQQQLPVTETAVAAASNFRHRLRKKRSSNVICNSALILFPSQEGRLGLLVTAPGLGQYISGAILFEETLYQYAVDGRRIVDVLAEQGIVPGIKVDKGPRPAGRSDPESWCQGLDGLALREAAYYPQGARFAKWRTVVSIPNGPSALAEDRLVPIVEPEILVSNLLH
uniref:fructose-bisphosphate aldolase n=1 Tax=Oryza barthii TaxID=65489 RepID=A0A0D3HRW4_9ORYZ